MPLSEYLIYFFILIRRKSEGIDIMRKIFLYPFKYYITGLYYFSCFLFFRSFCSFVLMNTFLASWRSQVAMSDVHFFFFVMGHLFWSS